MLYLVRPDLTVGYSDLPVRPRTLLDHARDNPDFDLAALEWKPADHRADPNAVRLALRHGVACSAGIVLPAIVLIDERRPRELAKGHRDVQDIRGQFVAEDELMERMYPGWKAHGVELNARVDESMAESVAEAQAEADELLAAPLQEGLLLAWTRLGGPVYERDDD